MPRRTSGRPPNHRDTGRIVDYFQRIIEGINSVPAHFVFNADETGHQEWTDRDERMCFVPAFHFGDQICDPVSRAGKRMTLLPCIAADGSYATTLVIIPRKTVDNDFWLTDMNREKAVIRS